jgi:hypothetical protein
MIKIVTVGFDIVEKVGFPTVINIFLILPYKVREMQNSSEVFKSKFEYYQHVVHIKLSQKNVLLDFPVSRFPAGGPCWNMFTVYFHGSS